LSFVLGDVLFALLAAKLPGCYVAFGCVVALRFVFGVAFGCVAALLCWFIRAHHQAQQSPPSRSHFATTKRCTSTPCAPFVPHFATGAGELSR